MPPPNVSRVDGRNGWVFPDPDRATYQNGGKGHVDLRQLAIAKGWMALGSEYVLGWFPVDDAYAGQTPDLLMQRDASGVLALRNGSVPQRSRVYGPDSAFSEMGSNAEAVSVAAAAFTDTALSLLPADAVIEGVTVRVLQSIPGVSTFSLGDASNPTRFGTNIPATVGTTRVCLDHVGTAASRQATGASVRLTPNMTPSGAGGSVQLGLFYRLLCTAGTWVVILGDSKSEIANTWPGLLGAKFATARGIPMMSSNAAQAGRGIVNAAASIVGILSTHYPNTDYPTVICNLGVNDFVGMPSQATLETAYLQIVDAIAARWPKAKVWLMRPWKQGFDAAADLMAGYIANVQAARSSFVSLGPDERVFLKGNDNGVSETVDGIHPSALGQTLYADQWFALPIFAT